MMETRKDGKVNWILDELPRLKSEGILDGASAEKLREYYSARAGSSNPAGRTFVRMAAVLGTLMVCGGIILFFAYNWELLPHPVRIAVSFVPLTLGLICGIYTLAADKGTFFRELSAMLCACGAAVLAALVSQIYHADGTLADYLRLVLLLGLPFVYIFRSMGGALIYAFGTIFLSENTGFSGHEQFFVTLAYILGILPLALWYFIREPDSMKSMFLRYAMILSGIAFAFLPFVKEFPVAAMLSMLFFIGLYVNDRGTPLLRNPFLGIGCLAATFWLAGACISQNRSWDWHGAHVREVYFGVIQATYIIGGLFMLAMLAVALTKKHLTPGKVVVFLLPLLTFISRELPGEDTLLGMHNDCLAANIFLLVLAVSFIFQGFRTKNAFEVNTGMVQLALLVLIHLFDSKSSYLVRGTVFAALGVILLVSNAIFARYCFRRPVPAGKKD